MTPDQALVIALVGQEHRDQYLCDADFHATVDQLAAMLPVWIEGLAAKCAASASVREQAVRDLMRQPFPASGVTSEGDAR